MFRWLPSYHSWKRIPILPHSTPSAPATLVSSWLLEQVLGWKACLLQVFPDPAPSPSWRRPGQILPDPHPFSMRAQVQFPGPVRAWQQASATPGAGQRQEGSWSTCVDRPEFPNWQTPGSVRDLVSKTKAEDRQLWPPSARE